ncbi:MAG: triose-phosphate isomerase [Verrucomicrobia bacterium]|nr:triose-phosphate isomerase [Verrucomicrobiota bacterium]
MPRDLYVIGNWKMYKTAREAAGYVEELEPKVQGCQAKIYLAVPYTSIASAARSAKNTPITIGAQNMNDAREGAFTGEIAALMLKEAGAEFVLLGHSERRKIFGESSEFVHKKTVRALQEGLQPIVCVGEDLEERESGRTEEVLKHQLEKSLSGIPAEDALKIILAYEPVWAIGTGKTATPKIAQEAHAFCRSCLADLFGKKVAGQISILYGGSVKPESAGPLAAQKDIDGVLVGGASLDPHTFAEIALNCEKPT